MLFFWNHRLSQQVVLCKKAIRNEAIESVYVLGTERGNANSPSCIYYLNYVVQNVKLSSRLRTVCVVTSEVDVVAVKMKTKVCDVAIGDSNRIHALNR
jgi:hypothetical protein